MASVNAGFRPSVRKGRCKGSLFIRIIHNRKVKNITLPYKIFPHEWDRINRRIVFPHHLTERGSRLREIAEKIEEEIHLMENVIGKIETEGAFTPEDVVEVYLRAKSQSDFLHFSENLIVQVEEKGQVRTANAYRSTLRRFRGFLQDADIQLHQLTNGVIRNFEKFLAECGLVPNSISFYMRNLRAMYNKSCEWRGTSKNHELFSQVDTAIHTTRKRALSSEELISLYRYGFGPDHKEKNPGILFALRIFFFSFFARGMSFVDIAFLRHSDITGGFIHYNRKKTRQPIALKITSELHDIIQAAGTDPSDSPFVFPIIRSEITARADYENGPRLQNFRLRRVSSILSIHPAVTTHVARHSWATFAKNENIPVGMISEGLGHSSEKTTYIYLASLDPARFEIIDEKIIAKIKNVI